MKTVAEVLDAKGKDVWSVSREASVQEALQLMAEKNAGALMVLEGGRPVGIVSERDVARKVALPGRQCEEVQIGEIMTPRVLFVRPDTDIDSCMALMSQHRVRHLPVMDGDELVGMLSTADVLRASIAEKDLAIEQLENYIKGQEAYF